MSSLAELVIKNQEVDQLIDTLQDTIYKLARRGYKLYDTDNDDCYITGNITYDKETMKFKIEYDKEDM